MTDPEIDHGRVQQPYPYPCGSVFSRSGSFPGPSPSRPPGRWRRTFFLVWAPPRPGGHVRASQVNAQRTTALRGSAGRPTAPGRRCRSRRRTFLFAPTNTYFAVVTLLGHQQRLEPAPHQPRTRTLFLTKAIVMHGVNLASTALVG